MSKEFANLDNLRVFAEYVPNCIELTQAQYDALSSTEKNDPTKYYYIKDAQIAGAEIDDTTTASDKVWSSQKVSTEIAKKADAGVWTSAVSCIVGDTSKTISNANITTSSIIDVYSETVSGKPLSYESVVVTTGQAVITFSSALTEATNIKLWIR